MKGKREAGESPARSRHCKRRAVSVHSMQPLRISGRRDAALLSVSQETCRLSVQSVSSDHEALIVPLLYTGFFVMPSSSFAEGVFCARYDVSERQEE